MVHIEIRFHPKEKIGLSSIHGVPNIAYYSDLDVYEYNGQQYSIITYSFYYPENPAIGCGGKCFPSSTLWGYHKHDIEKISVLYDRNYNPQYVYFFAHGRGQGMWVPWESCEKCSDGALVIYSALNSHASYPNGKTYVRVCGIINDVCSSKGKSIRPILQKAEDIQIAPGIRLSLSPIHPPQQSISTFERWFLMFYSNYIKLKK